MPMACYWYGLSHCAERETGMGYHDDVLAIFARVRHDTGR